jgi:hypothetical protein
MAVQIDLNRHRKPGLNPNMDQTEIAIHEVEVQMQAFPPCRLDERALTRFRLFEFERERTARFKDRVDTHQTLLDAIALGERSRGLLFINVRCQVLEWPSLALGHRHRMIFDAFRVFEQEWLEAREILLQTAEEFRHLPAGHDGKIAAKYHAVETAQHTMNPICIFANEFLHFLKPPGIQF